MKTENIRPLILGMLPDGYTYKVKPVGWGGSGVRTNRPHECEGRLVRAVSGRGNIAAPCIYVGSMSVPGAGVSPLQLHLTSALLPSSLAGLQRAIVLVRALPFAGTNTNVRGQSITRTLCCQNVESFFVLCPFFEQGVRRNWWSRMAQKASPGMQNFMPLEPLQSTAPTF